MREETSPGVATATIPRLPHPGRRDLRLWGALETKHPGDLLIRPVTCSLS